MDFLRSSVLRRSQNQHDQTLDLEHQAPRRTRVQDSPQVNSRPFITFSPRHLSSLFSTSSSLGLRGRQPNTGLETEEDDNGSKYSSPRFVNRFRMPSLPRARSSYSPDAQISSDEQGPNEAPRSSLARTQTQRFPVLAQPRPVRTAGDLSERRNSRTRFQRTDPAELHLAELAEDRRRRRHRRHRRHGSGSDEDPESNSASRRHRRHHHHHRSREPRGAPKRFLFCFPWVKSRRIRATVLRCFISGIFLVSMLAVYLSLSLTKKISSDEFSILLILLILLTTIFFCHGLVRLCMLLVRPKHRRGDSQHGENMAGSAGYAVPRRPIRVVLARDEEAAGIESDATKMEPPAYGLWRESVRVDPDRLFWQRAEPVMPESTTVDEEGSEHPQTGLRRPPSYASDEGVDYVVEARPRSIAPPPSSVYSQPSGFGMPAPEMYTSDVPLPGHPAETGSDRRLEAQMF